MKKILPIVLIAFGMYAKAQNNSANKVIWWADPINMTDTELDMWQTRGVGGFVFGTRHLYGMGGGNFFTGDPNNPLSGTGFYSYEYQRSIRNSNIVARLHARGMKAYLNFWAVNYYNEVTPYAEWFDDNGWNNVVLPEIYNIAGAAKLEGFDGLNIDQEMYPQQNGPTANWGASGTVPNGTTYPQIQAKVRQRGAEIMQQMVNAFPNLEVMIYFFQLPESWEAMVQLQYNGINFGPCGNGFMNEMFSGLSSVSGYSHIWLQDAMFYKTHQMSGATWDNALQYNVNRTYACWSRDFVNWEYAASRIALSPFIWIDSGTNGFEAARPAPYVDDQLDKFRKWGIDGQFSNFCYNPVNTAVSGYFDYTTPENYIPGMQATAIPGNVDAVPPTLVVSNPATNPISITQTTAISMSGYATDNLAVRYVEWTNTTTGASGMAGMNWNVLSGDYTTAYNWQMDWTIPAVSLQPGTNYIDVKVCDIKGLCTTQNIIVHNGSNTTGLSSPLFSGEIKIYPTLAKDGFYVETSQPTYNTTIKVLDVLGRTVVSGELPSGQNKTYLSTENITTGIYLVEVTNENKKQVQKIMVTGK